MVTKSIGKEYETITDENGRTRIKVNQKTVEAKMDVVTRLQYRHRRDTRVRYGKQGGKP